jgi:hypothetical protein
MTSKFKLKPDDKILNLLSQSLGFVSFLDKETVIKNTDLILKNIKQVFINLLPEINKYYTKQINLDYITDESRCITITRQFLKTRDLDILLVKKMINGEKIKCYKISYKNMRKIKIEKYKPKVISFDDW